MVAVGQEIDLVVKWGNQTRHKCPSCKRYMGEVDSKSATCRCGARYAATKSGRYRVEKLP